MSGVVNWLRTIGALFGTESHRNITAALTKASIKDGQGKLYSLRVANPNAVDVYLHLYDALTADVNVGTTVPINTYTIIAGDGTYRSVCTPVNLPVSPKRFQLGIGYAISTAIDATGAPAANCEVNADYI